MKKSLAIIIALCAIFTSCASKVRFEGNGDLCGLVLDENNSPVKDFIVYCRPAELKLKTSNPVVAPVITNESGLFVFYGLPSGEYILSGEKKNYLRLEHVKYRFDDRTKILCVQTKSFKAAVLSAEELLHLGQAQEAGEVLRGVCCDKGSSESVFLKEYIAKIKEVEK